MIRPRTGDFKYTDEEIDVMIEDIKVCKEYGVRGVVFGLLTRDGRVDVEKAKRIVDEALPLEICFHRAFDMTSDPLEALRDIMDIGGFSRILTSGQARSVPEALITLEALYTTVYQLVDGEPWTLTILPGSGINPETIRPILDALLPCGLQEIHLSGGAWEDGGMKYRPEGMGMGVGGQGEWGIWKTDENKIRRVRAIADEIYEELSAGPASPQDAGRSILG
ncbi:copper homeostasis protein cutC [Pluteus cervinus]|uniref:Copper homeostasis protein cutC n=1 Tax=Pluteus cervinus TaxID=181527 RepID=A0ACD3BH91_9AGAR|nr:copper homeostasis protein cutC [Pluteus cervinus]